jgi:hypothetical protein
MEERRRYLRQRLFVPVEIDGEKKKDRIGVARNASACGMLLGTPSHFEVGERVTLRLALAPQVSERLIVSGRIVRIAVDDAADWFARLVAIKFDQELPKLSSAADISAS